MFGRGPRSATGKDPSSVFGDSYEAEATHVQHPPIQMQRSKEASKQMVYGVFSNVIGILEEYERREMRFHKIPWDMPTSGIQIPEQGHKRDEDIDAILQTQIMTFENIVNFCPPDALDDMIDDLRTKVIGWAASREEMCVAKDICGEFKTDDYLAKMYELLVTGTTDHQPAKQGVVTQDELKRAVQAYMQGNEQRLNLEEQFKEDRDRPAEAPSTRSAELLKRGTQRLLRTHKGRDLKKYLKEDEKMVTHYHKNGDSNN